MSTTTRPRAAAPVYKLSTLFGLAKEIGLEADEAKDMAYDMIGKDSLKKFTQREVNEVCFELMARKDRMKKQTGRITDQQLYKVREYERLLGWDDDPMRIAKFVEKYYHCASVLWLTPAQAAKLIESLKSMCERARSEAPTGGDPDGDGCKVDR